MKPIADVSKWQGVIDYPTLISKTDGVVIRASASYYADIRFAQNYDGLQGHPGVIGAYHYLYSNRDARAQADVFLDVIGDHLFDFLVIDVEDNAVGFTKSQMAAHVMFWINRVRQFRPSDEIRIYTRGEWWDTNVGVAGWEQNYRLWVAHYGTMTPRVPLAWEGVWTMHQYTDRGNGAEYGVSSASIDLNRMNPEFYPPPPPVGFPKAGVTVAAVNFRRYPVVSDCTKIRTLPQAAALTITGEDDGSCGYDWWQVVASDGTEGWVAKPFVKVTG